MILDTLLSETQFAELEQDISKLTNEIDEANAKNTEYIELNNQYSQNKTDIETLKKKQINTLDLFAKICELKKTKSIKSFIARRDYFSSEFEKRTLAIEKYLDNRGFVLTKDERKERYYVDLQLAPLTKLENELATATKINENIKKLIEEIEQKNKSIVVKRREQFSENNILLSTIETIKSKLQYLQTFQRNQLLLKKCIPIIKEKHISIDDDDDYEDIKNKIKLDYADSLKYEGPMYPLCLNEECSGVNIGYPCQCRQNKNIWFTLTKPKSYTDYITVADFELFPELNEPLGYLISRDNSIDDYLEYAEKHKISYYNYTDLFVSVNIHHHDNLRETYCVLSEDYPKNYNNYDCDSDNECYEDCYFDINSDEWTCSCGHRQFVWEDEDFDPMKHSLLDTKPCGTLRNEY
jgi:hypothetical protein